jgi:hypothetical protein
MISFKRTINYDTILTNCGSFKLRFLEVPDAATDEGFVEHARRVWEADHAAKAPQ